MLLFLHRLDYCWKCKIDTDVKIENYYHHDGEQLGFDKEKNISKHRAKIRMTCNLYIAGNWRNEEF